MKQEESLIWRGMNGGRHPDWLGSSTAQEPLKSIVVFTSARLVVCVGRAAMAVICSVANREDMPRQASL